MNCDLVMMAVSALGTVFEQNSYMRQLYLAKGPVFVIDRYTLHGI